MTADVDVRERRCNVLGCGRRHQALGLCKSHYDRLRETGETWDTFPVGDTRYLGLRLRQSAAARADGAGICRCAGPDPDGIGQCFTCHGLVVTFAHPSVAARFAERWPDEWARAVALHVRPPVGWLDG